jgi:hypothetical protein
MVALSVGAGGPGHQHDQEREQYSMSADKLLTTLFNAGVGVSIVATEPDPC